jgi:hypothetical protein
VHDQEEHEEKRISNCYSEKNLMKQVNKQWFDQARLLAFGHFFLLHFGIGSESREMEGKGDEDSW